jgi:hypothetical protein
MGTSVLVGLCLRVRAAVIEIVTYGDQLPQKGADDEVKRALFSCDTKQIQKTKCVMHLNFLTLSPSGLARVTPFLLQTLRKDHLHFSGFPGEKGMTAHWGAEKVSPFIYTIVRILTVRETHHGCGLGMKSLAR